MPPGAQRRGARPAWVVALSTSRGRAGSSLPTPLTPLRRERLRWVTTATVPRTDPRSRMGLSPPAASRWPGSDGPAPMAQLRERMPGPHSHGGPSLGPGPNRPAHSGLRCLHGGPDRRLSCLHSQGLTFTQGRPPPISSSGQPEWPSLPVSPTVALVMPSSPCPDPPSQGCQPPPPAPHQAPGSRREAGLLVSLTCRKLGLKA